MRKTIEIIERIIHILLNLLNIGCIFFALMCLFINVAEIGVVFKLLSISCCFPMFFMRMYYLQYILFAIILIAEIWLYVLKVKNKEISKKWLAVDIVLWAISAVELIFLESYYWNIYWF